MAIRLPAKGIQCRVRVSETIIEEGMIFTMKSLMTKRKAFVLIASFLCSLTLIAANLAWSADFEHVTPATLKKMIETGEKGFLVVDVQPEGAYKIGHVKGAVNFPWDQELKSSGNLPKDKLLILYCDCGHEEDSIDAATQLRDKWNYTNIKLLEGGWSGWMQLGYPVEK
jgi:rhodanese-related sulfurtransferase